MSGAVIDAESVGLDEYTAGALVGAASATLCGAQNIPTDTDVPTDTPLPDPTYPADPGETDPTSDADMATGTPPLHTCADLHRVSASYVIRSGTDSDATHYWPQITVRNRSKLQIHVTLGGKGKATFHLNPSSAPDADWNLEDNGHDVAALKTSIFTPEGSGMYGAASLTVFPGDKITTFAVTAHMSIGDDPTDDSTLTCPLHVRAARR